MTDYIMTYGIQICRFKPSIGQKYLPKYQFSLIKESQLLYIITYEQCKRDKINNKTNMMYRRSIMLCVHKKKYRT